MEIERMYERGVLRVLRGYVYLALGFRVRVTLTFGAGGVGLLLLLFSASGGGSNEDSSCDEVIIMGGIAARARRQVQRGERE